VFFTSPITSAVAGHAQFFHQVRVWKSAKRPVFYYWRLYAT